MSEDLVPDEPPPFRPPAGNAAHSRVEVVESPPPVRAASPSSVLPPAASVSIPRWILVYAIAVKPTIWVLQRIINIVTLIAIQNDPDFNSSVLALLSWVLISFVITALIAGCGLWSWPRPMARAPLLRFAVGVSVVLGVLIALLVVVAMAMDQSKDSSEDSLAIGVAVLAGTALWLGTLTCECVIWWKLRMKRI